MDQLCGGTQDVKTFHTSRFNMRLGLELKVRNAVCKYTYPFKNQYNVEYVNHTIKLDPVKYTKT